MTTILSVDPGSSRCAYWLYDTENGPTIHFGFFDSKPEVVLGFFKALCWGMAGRPHMVALETIYGGGFAPYRVPHLITTARAEGYILSACSQYNIPVTCVAAGDWRKAVIGKPKATDKDIKAWVYEHFRLGSTNCHTRDALCLAHYVAHMETYLQCRPANSNSKSRSLTGNRRSRSPRKQ